MQPHTMIRTLALATALIAPTLQAQTTSRTQVGVAIGGTASRATDVNVASGDLFNGTGTVTNRYGVHVGVYLNRALSGNFSFQPELYYVQKGTKLDFGGSGQAPGTFTLAMDYVEVPLLLRMDFGAANTVHPFVTAGPSVAMRVGCKASVKSSDLSLSVDCQDFEGETGQTDPFEKLDVGASVGAGLAGTLAGRTALMQLRYGRGFTTLTKDSESNQAPKHSVISLIVGLGW